ncbi:unnamed protein product, partial [Chrysoparadoxa australica]
LAASRTGPPPVPPARPAQGAHVSRGGWEWSSARAGSSEILHSCTTFPGAELDMPSVATLLSLVPPSLRQSSLLLHPSLHRNQPLLHQS